MPTVDGEAYGRSYRLAEDVGAPVFIRSAKMMLVSCQSTTLERELGAEYSMQRGRDRISVQLRVVQWAVQ